MSKPEEKPRVYVNAIFCSDIIREREPVDLLTAIRVTSAFSVNPITATIKLYEGAPEETDRPELIYHPVKFHAIVTFWSEGPRDFDFTIRGHHPSGEAMNTDMKPLRVSLQAPTNGHHTINLNSTIPGTIPGVHWFEFCVDGVMITKLPLVILHPKKDALPSAKTTE